MRRRISGLTMYDVESQRVLLDNIHGRRFGADAVEELKSPSRCRRLPADRDAAMLARLMVRAICDDDDAVSVGLNAMLSCTLSDIDLEWSVHLHAAQPNKFLRVSDRKWEAERARRNWNSGNASQGGSSPRCIAVQDDPLSFESFISRHRLISTNTTYFIITTTDSSKAPSTTHHIVVSTSLTSWTPGAVCCLL